MNRRLIIIMPSIVVGLIVLFYLCFYISVGRFISISEFGKFSKIIIKSAIMHPVQSTQTSVFDLAIEVLTNNQQDGGVLSSPNMSTVYGYPLPNQSAFSHEEAGLSRYFSFASEQEIDQYYNKVLPEHGWQKIDQLGPLSFYEKDGIRLNIERRFYLGKDITEFTMSLGDVTWKTYTNEKYGYSIEFPTNWYFQSISADTDFNQQEPDKYNIGGEWYLTPQDPGKYKLENFPKHIREIYFGVHKVEPNIAFAKFFQDRQINVTGAQQESIEINGMPAYKLKFTTTDSNTGETITAHQTFIKNKDKIFMFTSTIQGVSEEHEKIIEHIIQSFRVE